MNSRTYRSNQCDDYDVLVKCVVIGDAGVGKSSLMARFADDEFHHNYIATIGVDFKLCTLEIGDKRVKLQLWDTAGQERFKSITTAYYRGAHGVILVFDVTDRESFSHVYAWMADIDRYANEGTPVVLVGNKVDMGSRRVISSEEAYNTAHSLGIPYFDASAKSGYGVENTFLSMAQQCATRRLRDKKDVPPRPPLRGESVARETSCCCLQ